MATSRVTTMSALLEELSKRAPSQTLEQKLRVRAALLQFAATGSPKREDRRAPIRG